MPRFPAGDMGTARELAEITHVAAGDSSSREAGLSGSCYALIYLVEWRTISHFTVSFNVFPV